ncbi:hypothetical protein SBP18_01545 [Rhodoferax ferrireducens]|uniref:hypothetical protein n=1 Tax=Rhodoferax ferrireducens TaxID=192843 RepID=UPI00298DB178|nr:hypothetical protein [Rhodoferax ferrireducens]WPC67213.1 hypothetical protein SBP18_01545 [Rhodoferax ferrireducens]
MKTNLFCGMNSQNDELDHALDCRRKTQSRLPLEPHEPHRKVGKLTFDFAGTGHSPPMSRTWEQSDKDEDQFFRLAVNSAAERVIQVRYQFLVSLIEA